MLEEGTFVAFCCFQERVDLSESQNQGFMKSGSSTDEHETLMKPVWILVRHCEESGSEEEPSYTEEKNKIQTW